MKVVLTFDLTDSTDWRRYNFDADTEKFVMYLNSNYSKYIHTTKLDDSKVKIEATNLYELDKQHNMTIDDVIKEAIAHSTSNEEFKENLDDIDIFYNVANIDVDLEDVATFDEFIRSADDLALFVEDNCSYSVVIDDDECICNKYYDYVVYFAEHHSFYSTLADSIISRLEEKIRKFSDVVETDVCENLDSANMIAVNHQEDVEVG